MEKEAMQDQPKEDENNKAFINMLSTCDTFSAETMNLSKKFRNLKGPGLRIRNRVFRSDLYPDPVILYSDPHPWLGRKLELRIQKFRWVQLGQ